MYQNVENLNKVYIRSLTGIGIVAYTLKICFSGNTSLKVMNSEHTYYSFDGLTISVYKQQQKLKFVCLCLTSHNYVWINRKGVSYQLATYKQLGNQVSYKYELMDGIRVC